MATRSTRGPTENFTRLKDGAMLLENEPSLYFYRLRMGPHEQVGVAACFSLDEYDRDVIKKHERTRADKEDDRTRHMIALGAQTGPVFLTYRASSAVDSTARQVMDGEPLYDFDAPDGVRHTLWKVPPARPRRSCEAFHRIPALYIADGHHRAASAARARAHVAARMTRWTTAPAPARCSRSRFLTTRSRSFRTTASSKTSEGCRRRPSSRRFESTSRSIPVRPRRRGAGEIAMYFQGEWRTLRPRARPDSRDAIGSLDVSVLQDRLLSPILGIVDVRTDKRIDFVGGARGTAELERLVDAGQAAAAFSLFPVSVADLMAVSDAGAIMPPKSTWFEPKLRDGLLIHMI